MVGVGSAGCFEDFLPVKASQIDIVASAWAIVDDDTIQEERKGERDGVLRWRVLRMSIEDGKEKLSMIFRIAPAAGWMVALVPLGNSFTGQSREFFFIFVPPRSLKNTQSRPTSDP